MEKIFGGLLFIFLDFNLSFNEASIDVIPDFIGFYLILSGFQILENESEVFKNAKSVLSFIMIFSIITSFLSIMGGNMMLGDIVYIFGFVNMTALLLVLNYIVNGVSDMENKYNCNLNATALKNILPYIILTSIFGYFLDFAVSTLAIIFIVIGFISFIIFLNAFSISKNLYNQIKK